MPPRRPIARCDELQLAGAAGPFYGTTGWRKQRVAAAKLSVQDLSKDHGPTGTSRRRRRLHLGLSTCKGLRAGTGPPDGYARVHCGKRTTQPRDPQGAGQSYALDFGPNPLHADRPTGLGPGSHAGITCYKGNQLEEFGHARVTC